MIDRWLFHPRPMPDESLVSWMARLGDSYGMSTIDFVDSLAGITWEQATSGNLSGADLSYIARKSGQTVQRITRMALPLQAPWTSPEFPSRATVGLLTSENRIELPPESTFIQEAGWFRRGCRVCMSENQPYWRTLWDCTLVSSCIRHGVLLEAFKSHPEHPRRWMQFDGNDPVKSSQRVLQLDRRTARAIRDGFVQLPGRRLDAVTWFKLIESAMAEVVRPAAAEGRQQKELVAESWKRAGIDRAVMTGRHQAFDKRLPKVREQVLAASAELIALVGKRPDAARGALADTLSSPEYRERLSRPLAKIIPVDTTLQRYKLLFELMEETLIAARTSLPTARAVFGILCSPEYDEGAAARAIEKMRNELRVEESIIAKLGDVPPSNPFAPFYGIYIGSSEARPWRREARSQSKASLRSRPDVRSPGGE